METAIPAFCIAFVGKARAWVFQGGPRLRRLSEEVTFQSGSAERGRLPPAAVDGHHPRVVVARNLRTFVLRLDDSELRSRNLFMSK